MMTIYLHGNLKQFGSRFDLHVADSAEAVRALCSQLQGFRKVLQGGHFKLRHGNQVIMPEGLEKTLREQGHKTLHITPVVMGAGGRSSGLLQVVIGAALVVAAFWTGGWSLTGLSTLGTIAASMGFSLILGGVSQMLTKTPSVGDVKDSKNLQSSAFSGLQNMAANGQPVPLIYGEVLVGSLVISQGITSYSTQSGNSTGFTTPKWLVPKERKAGEGAVERTRKIV
ncbi:MULTISPECIES: tail assembly protein [Neisseria]|uniref:Tail assembly protein n=1 Tax=Neisseria brasiliensis TaxID=2666100 RepID=A0A7X2GZJ1_9NEIS|nr:MULTISPECIES: tail assembly protein [Neisseria]MRN38617.1 tail assembly protein [Neisseria brasiliensis]